MSVVDLTDAVSGSSAKIAVNLGFNCFEFVAKLRDGRSVSVIDAAEGFENGDQPLSHSGIPLLFPFPNRIRDGRYSWNDVDYHLPAGQVAHEANGNAIHGFCLDRPWRMIEQTGDTVVGQFQLSVDAPDRLPLWPADFIISVRYSVQGAALLSEITVQNPGDSPLPWGFGTHGYFRLPLQTDSDPAQCTVFAPVSRKWSLDECLPSGTVSDQLAIPLDGSPKFGGLKLDDVFTGIRTSAGRFECRIGDPQAGLEVVQECSNDFREIVAFTPPWSTAVCLEPYTCVTDAINLQQRGIDAGLNVLPPRDSWTGLIDICVRPIK
jgi:aldose 1-epimerase